MKILPCLPILAFSIATAVIIFAYHTTFSDASILAPLKLQTKSELVTPPISLLMFDGPGRLLGQIGFPLVSLAAILIAVPLRQQIKLAVIPSDNESKDTRNIDTIFAVGGISFMSLALVGLIPLQRDILTNSHLNWDSIVHQVCAGIFFLTSMLHMGLWLRFVLLSATVRRSCVIHYTNSPLSFLWKALCFVFSFFPLPLSFLLHPASPMNILNDGSVVLSSFDRGGLHQYFLVLCVALFYLSYSFELMALQREDVAHKECSKVD